MGSEQTSYLVLKFIRYLDNNLVGGRLREQALFSCVEMYFVDKNKRFWAD